MTDKTRRNNWVRIAQALGLFAALVVLLPWIGGKLIPGRGHDARELPAPPAVNRDAAADLPEAASSQPSGKPEALEESTPPSENAPEREPYQPEVSAEALAKLPAELQSLVAHQGWLQPYSPARGIYGNRLRQFTAGVSPTLPLANDVSAYEAFAVNMAEGRGCLVRLLAGVRNGKPDAQERYKYCQWTFGDGTFLLDSTPFTDDTLSVMHFFTAPQGGSATYIVRVQVQDSAGAIVYGDSLPIVVK